MAKINFYLKGVSSQETLAHLQKNDKELHQELVNQFRPIICSISFDGRREIFATQISMSLQFWDIKKQEVKSGWNSNLIHKSFIQCMFQ